MVWAVWLRSSSLWPLGCLLPLRIIPRFTASSHGALSSFCSSLQFGLCCRRAFYANKLRVPNFHFVYVEWCGLSMLPWAPCSNLFHPGAKADKHISNSGVTFDKHFLQEAITVNLSDVFAIGFCFVLLDALLNSFVGHFRVSVWFPFL